jgi:regulator of protease activity HflC (stomatin/prohibitin superfamily)
MGAILGTIGSFFVVALLCAGLYGFPQYNIYSSRMAGEAELAQATYSKQVAVQTAQAKLDAAKLEAETDVTRAGGVAQANKILADGLGGPEGYLRWKYIQMLEDTASSASKTVIYVPTEAGLPILEAGRRGAQP